MNEINFDIQDLQERFDALNIKYFTNAFINNNELVREACCEYLELINHREQHQKTILCSYKEHISKINI